MTVRDFLRSGSHTWDLNLEYHQCKNCGKIVEDRQAYEARHDRLEKEVNCPFCETEFTVSKPVPKTLGPLL